MSTEVTPPDRPRAHRSARGRFGEKAVLLALAAAATISVLVTVGIVVVLVEEGALFFTDVPITEFFTGTQWFPLEGKFGVLPLLNASIVIALIAAVVAVPLGLGSAIYLSEYAPERLRRVVKPVLEILAGMPTIVLGFFALDAVTPALQMVFPGLGLYNALAAGIVVGLLITPLISSLSEDAMRAVPNSMREGAFGLGATRRVVSLRVVVPAALSGIVASIVLAISRAIGETMAVTLAAGTIPNLSWNPLEGMQTITAYIVQVSKGEATRGSLQYESIFAVGLLLFVVTLVINIIAVRIVRRYRTEYQ
ncbi:MAG: phosphate ABC transporter permease subunit PstC [Miltoncostaeaceae bacterium]